METTFSNGEKINNYNACAQVEGYDKISDELIDDVKAWSFLIGTKLAYSLQGWFGRNARTIIKQGVISEDGVVNWDEFQNLYEQ